MLARLHSWWQNTSKTLDAVVILMLVVLVSLVVVIVLGYANNWSWAGLHGKTFWDWLQLLFIPAMLTLGAIWFTSRQNHDRQIAVDDQGEVALQGYIDKMSGLLLENKLRESQPEDEVRKIARVRTLTVLPRLDANRKSSVLQFLCEANLIEKDKPIINLGGADLSGANLHEANLIRANLRLTNLSGANLSHAQLLEADLSHALLYRANLSRAVLIAADLSEAYLSEADLSSADLRIAHLNEAILLEADLSEADLTRADVTTEQLKAAKSLKGTIMPDGSEHD